MDNVIFNATDDLLNEPIVDGQILFSTNGDGRMAIDKEETRYDLGGVIRTDTTIDKNSSKAIQSRAIANAIVNNMQDIETTTEGNYIAGALALKQLKNDLEENFQNGVDSVYNACIEAGSTPESKKLSDIVSAIGKCGKVYCLGRTNSTIDVKTKLPNLYNKLTKDNFFVAYCTANGSAYVSSFSSGTGYVNTTAPSSFSYDSSNGVFTLSGGSYSSSNNGFTTFDCYTAKNENENAYMKGSANVSISSQYPIVYATLGEVVNV